MCDDHARALSMGRSSTAIADTGSIPAVGRSRLSRITSGTTLVHADLHNHTLLSDGDGDPALAYDSMRSAGLDVAALTDHSTLSDHVLGDVLRPGGDVPSVPSRGSPGERPWRRVHQPVLAGQLIRLEGGTAGSRR